MELQLFGNAVVSFLIDLENAGIEPLQTQNTTDIEAVVSTWKDLPIRDLSEVIAAWVQKNPRSRFVRINPGGIDLSTRAPEVLAVHLENAERVILIES